MRTNLKQTSSDNNRKRPIQVKFRLSEDEYNNFIKQVNSSGMTAQDYILSALNQTPIIDAVSRKLITETHQSMKDIQLQMKGIGINVNQMAHVANINGNLPTAETLSTIYTSVYNLGKEVGNLCRLLSPLIKVRAQKRD